MKFNFDSLVVNVMNLFSNWLLPSDNEYAWCRIKVDNRFDRF